MRIKAGDILTWTGSVGYWQPGDQARVIDNEKLFHCRHQEETRTCASYVHIGCQARANWEWTARPLHAGMKVQAIVPGVYESCCIDFIIEETESGYQLKELHSFYVDCVSDTLGELYNKLLYAYQHSNWTFKILEDE